MLTLLTVYKQSGRFQGKYFNTSKNPTDLSTQWLNVQSLTGSNWLTGPSWLSRISKEGEQESEKDWVEITSSKNTQLMQQPMVKELQEAVTVIICAIQSERFSVNWNQSRGFQRATNQRHWEELKALLTGPLCGYLWCSTSRQPPSMHYFKVWRKVSHSDAKEKPCCRSNNMSLLQTSPPLRSSDCTWCHLPSWVLVDWKPQYLDKDSKQLWCMQKFEKTSDRTAYGRPTSRQNRSVAPPFTMLVLMFLVPGQYVLVRRGGTANSKH